MESMVECPLCDGHRYEDELVPAVVDGEPVMICTECNEGR